MIKKRPAVSRELNWIIMKALSPNFLNRYKSAAQIMADLNKIEAKKADHTSELKEIKERIEAREIRADYKCWNCHKTMPRKMTACLYCGAEQ
jgi:hypothetical protein